jgi:hypothetical protein
MNRLPVIVFILTSLLLPLTMYAQDDRVGAEVAISIKQEKDNWVGQQVTLNLDLKTTGYSFSNVHINLPEVSGAFLMQTDTTTIKLTEKIDGQSWQVVRYPLALYPQKAGQLEIPSIGVRFTTSAGFGSTEEAFEFQTSPLDLTVGLPPGVKQGDLVITTTSFGLDHNWQPVSGTAQTGDAITLTVTRRASDISAMLLPPIPVFETEGLAAYPQTPEVNDKAIRGDLTGERVDSIIWVVEKPGLYSIPGIRFQWWDPDSRELEQQIVPGLSLDIMPPPTDKTAAETGEKPGYNSYDLFQVLIFGLAFVLAVALWVFFRPKTPGQHQVNEKSTFNHLQKACRSHHPGQIHSAIHAWFACSLPTFAKNSQPLTLGEFARICDDEQLATELEKLQEAMVSPGNSWQADDLLVSLKRVRHKINKQKTVRSRAYLSPLNP